MRLIIQRDVAKIPSELLDEKDKRIAVSDFLTRAFGHQTSAFNRTVKGSGKNGKIFIDHCGQEMLERTSVVLMIKKLKCALKLVCQQQDVRFLEKLRPIHL